MYVNVLNKNKCVLPVSTVISVDLTVNATKAERTCAGIAVDTVGTVCSIFTGVTFTLVYVLLTAPPTEARQTRTSESVNAIATQPAITAGIYKNNWKQSDASFWSCFYLCL